MTDNEHEDSLDQFEIKAKIVTVTVQLDEEQGSTLKDVISVGVYLIYIHSNYFASHNNI